MSLVTSSPTKWKGIGATKRIAGEGFKREWPPLIKMDEAVKAKVERYQPGAVVVRRLKVSTS